MFYNPVDLAAGNTIHAADTEAMDINNNGFVAGRYLSTVKNHLGQDVKVWKAFVFDGANMLDLGAILSKLLADYSAKNQKGEAEHSFAIKINSDGIVVGKFTTLGHNHAFAYRLGSTDAVDLHQYLDPVQFTDSTALGINDLGEIVGTRKSADPQSKHVNSWFLDYNNPQPSAVHLDDLAGLKDGMVVSDINSHGDISGWTPGVPGDTMAFLFPYKATPPAPAKFIGSKGSYAQAVSDDRLVVGSSPFPNTIPITFIYDFKTDQLNPLADYTLEAYGINNSGDVVGSSHWPASAFLDKQGQLAQLSDLLPANTPWKVSQARAINDYGYIVGNGYLNGQPRAFLLSPMISSLPVVLKPLPWAVWDCRLLFSTNPEGAGVIALPGGVLLQIPPGPQPDAVYQAFTRMIEDTLAGLAVRRIGSASERSPARREIERTGFDLVEQAALRFLQSLELLKKTPRNVE